MYQRGAKSLAPSWYRDHDYHDGYANRGQGFNQEDARKVLLRQVDMSLEVMGSNHGAGKRFFCVKYLWNLNIKLGINCLECIC